MRQRRDAILQRVQLGLCQLAQLGIAEQRLGLGLRAFGGAQLVDARDHRLELGQFAGCMDIGFAGQALGQSRAQLLGPRGDPVQLWGQAHVRRSGTSSSGTAVCSPVARSFTWATPCANVILADDDGGAGTDAVGALHAATEIAAIGHLGADAGVAERLQQAERGGFRRLADRHDSDRGSRLGHRVN